jgi:hypothetical protein
MTNKLEGGGHGLINVLSRHLPGRMKEKHENSQNSHYSGKNSNQASLRVTVTATCLVKYYYGYYIKENEMGRTCNMHRENEKNLDTKITERVHLERLGINRRITSKWTLNQIQLG